MSKYAPLAICVVGMGFGLAIAAFGAGRMSVDKERGVIACKFDDAGATAFGDIKNIDFDAGGGRGISINCMPPVICARDVAKVGVSTAADVIAGCGRPARINTSDVGYGKQEQWVYEHHFANGGNDYVYVVDGKVSAVSY